MTKICSRFPAAVLIGCLILDPALASVARVFFRPVSASPIFDNQAICQRLLSSGPWHPWRQLSPSFWKELIEQEMKGPNATSPTIDILESAGIDYCLEHPEVIIHYLSLQLTEEHARPFPIVQLTDEPTRAFEMLIAMSEGGIRNALERRIKAHYFQAGMLGIREAIERLTRRSGETETTPRHVLSIAPTYGGTSLLLETSQSETFIAEGVEFSEDREKFYREFGQKITPDTRMVYFESITNPRVDVVDIRRLEQIVLQRLEELGIPQTINGLPSVFIVVDNAFATSRGLQPLDLGAHIVINIATKGETAGKIRGASMVGPKEIIDQIPRNADLQKTSDEIIRNGLFGHRFLPRRLPHQSETAMTLAAWVDEESRKADAVIKPDSTRYPGLDRHPDHAVAILQGMGVSAYGFGSVFYVEFKTVQLARWALDLMGITRLWKNAVSLGKKDTLAELPDDTTHQLESRKAKKLGKITREGMRIAVGMADATDLIRELNLIFGILKDHPMSLSRRLFNKLERALMARRYNASGQYEPIMRANPLWDKHARKAEARPSDDPVFVDIRDRILRATALDTYNPMSIVLLNWVKNQLTGNHLEMDPSLGGDTNFPFRNARAARKAFTPVHQRGQGPSSFDHLLYYRIGTPSSKTWEILTVAMLFGWSAALENHVSSVAFLSVEEAETMIHKFEPGAKIGGDYVIIPAELFGRKIGAVVLTSVEKAWGIPEKKTKGLGHTRGAFGGTAPSDEACYLALNYWFQAILLGYEPSPVEAVKTWRSTFLTSASA
jgi:cystathionine beta-lyase/cystathionine gamma-synthase